MKITKEKKYVSLGMKAVGDGFLQCIGMSLVHADKERAKKIKEAFAIEWERYKSIGIALTESQERIIDAKRN